MKKGIAGTIAVVFMTSSAWAQYAPAASPEGKMPAVSTPDSTNPTAPVAGKNSFTESQAKSRLEAAGYDNITDLKLNDQGVWQASAMKDTRKVMVGLDYQGNIVAK